MREFLLEPGVMATAAYTALVLGVIANLRLDGLDILLKKHNLR